MLRLDFGKAIQEKEQAFAHIPRTAPTLTELLGQIIMKLSDFKHAIARFFGKCKREDTMPNIQDYVIWRGDLPLDRVPLCDVDALLLCVGHGDARKFLEATPLPDSVRVIDLSQDFRLSASSSIGGRRFVYGLPEMNRERIRSARNIANPGCFATCLQLGMLPLAAAGLLRSDVHVTALTGSTGAGQKLAPTSHFSQRVNNLSVYKAFTHQHLNEIGESVRSLMPSFSGEIDFVPYRGDFARGIIASIYTDCDLSEERARKLYEDYYADAALTFVSDRSVCLKQVVNTSKCVLSVEKHGDKLLVVSAIDNLLKGASGQAVQNMNLMFGLDERAGLRLKPVAF